MELAIEQIRRFSADEYLRLFETGVLDPQEHTELLDGRIVLKMAQGRAHLGGIALGTDVFTKRLADTHWVVPQSSIRLSYWSVPEPDFVLARRDTWRPGADLHNGDLFVEVADTSMSRDRKTKAPIYAAAGVPEYWIINLRLRQVEVHRDPSPRGFQTVTVHHESESIAARCRPDVSILVVDLLPPPGTPMEQP